MRYQLSRENQRQLREDYVLDEARSLLWANGFDRTTIKDIATACGCTQGNIYNYFGSKEDILYLILLDEMKQLIKMIAPLENNLKMSPIEQLRTLIKKHVEHTLTPSRGKLLHFEMEMRYLSTDRQRVIIKLRNVYDRVLRTIIRRGVDQGVFRKVDEKVVNYGIASMVIRARVWYSPEGELSTSEVANAIFDLFYHGIGAKE